MIKVLKTRIPRAPRRRLPRAHPPREGRARGCRGEGAISTQTEQRVTDKDADASTPAAQPSPSKPELSRAGSSQTWNSRFHRRRRETASLESQDCGDGPRAQGECLWTAGSPLFWGPPWAGNTCSCPARGSGSPRHSPLRWPVPGLWADRVFALQGFIHTCSVGPAFVGQHPCLWGGPGNPQWAQACVT